MLALYKQLPDTRTPHEQPALERQIEAADRQIDALVYELYGLTEEEIEIVQGRGDEWIKEINGFFAILATHTKHR